MTSKPDAFDSLQIDTKTTSAEEPILKLRSVTLTGLDDPTFNMHGVDWELPSGHLAVIHMNVSQHPRDFASALQGIFPVRFGDIQFCGVTWTQSDVALHCQRRGEIGRVFEQNAWVNNLNIRENVLLRAQQLGFAEKQLDEEIERLRSQLEVPPLSRERPAFVDQPRLQRFQWLRAFIGKPKLLILERPLKALQSKALAVLLSAIESLVETGSSVLWFAGTQPEFEFSTRVPCSRWIAGIDGIHLAKESVPAATEPGRKMLEEQTQRKEPRDE
ncbi:MAG: hypothetical protein AAF664_14155 [Planctomycetota bacterium]